MARVRRSWELLVVLSERTLRARYRGSLLGVYWSLLNPLAMSLVYAGIFGHTFSKYYAGSVTRYGLEVFIGLSLVNFFAMSTSQALPSVVNNSGLINKVRLPMVILPVSTVMALSVQLAVGTLPILAIVTLVVTHNPLRLLLLPLPLVGLVLLCIGVALIVSTAYIFFRDIPHIYELITFLAWITSPVFYPLAIVPESVRHFLYFNPLFPSLTSMRQIAVTTQAPDPLLICASLFGGLIVCAVGYGIFNGLRRQFMDLI